jgi:hypothetical protein
MKLPLISIATLALTLTVSSSRQPVPSLPTQTNKNLGGARKDVKHHSPSIPLRPFPSEANRFQKLPRGGSSEHAMTPLISFCNLLADLCPHGMLPLAFGLMSTPGSTGAISAAMILTAFAVLGWYGLGSMGRAKEIGGGDGDSLSSVHR